MKGRLFFRTDFDYQANMLEILNHSKITLMIKNPAFPGWLFRSGLLINEIYGVGVYES
jgi:hypothetical protein